VAPRNEETSQHGPGEGVSKRGFPSSVPDRKKDTKAFSGVGGGKQKAPNRPQKAMIFRIGSDLLKTLRTLRREV